MSRDWKGFLKSLLFIFFGAIFGTITTVIYLAVDVDLSQFDGLQILTAVLIVITIWYADSTHRMLEEQRKSRQKAEIEKQLEMLYYPLKDNLHNSYKRENSTMMQPFDKIIPFQSLASDRLKEPLNDLIESRNNSPDFFHLKEGVENKVKEDIENLNSKLNKIN